MTGHRKFSELTDKLDARPGAKGSHKKAKAALRVEIEAYEKSLAELRRAKEFTQTQLATILDVSQAQVSRIENQTDLYLSTLQSYLEAMGGRLELVGVFDNETRVVLSLDELAPENSPTARAA